VEAIMELNMTVSDGGAHKQNDGISRDARQATLNLPFVSQPGKLEYPSERVEDTHWRVQGPLLDALRESIVEAFPMLTESILGDVQPFGELALF
jgi:hypothetical protein